MGRCEVCGNDYDKTFEVTAAGVQHVFDSSNAPSTGWRRSANTVPARSSATASRSKAGSSVAPTAARDVTGTQELADRVGASHG